MKIIRPIEIGDQQILSDAPDDGLPLWEPVGRDLSQDYNNALVSATATEIYSANIGDSASTTNSFVKRQTALTGATEVFETTPPIRDGIDSMAVSPDGGFLAVASTDGVVTVYDTSDGTVAYTRSNFVKGLRSLVDSRSVSFIRWTPDSSKLCFWVTTFQNGLTNDTKPRICIVSTFDWSEVLSDKTLTDFDPLNFASHDSVSPGPFCISDDGLFAFATGGFKNNEDFDKRFEAILRVDLSDGSTTGKSNVAGDLTQDVISCNSISHNPTRSEVVLAGRTVARVLEDDTLDRGALEPDLSNTLRGFTSYAEIYASGGFLFVTDNSLTERGRTYSLADYTDEGALNTGTLIELLGETSGLYISRPQNTEGFELFDKSDFSEVGNTNPTILAGNRLIYKNTIYESLDETVDRPDVGATISPPTWLNLGAINRLRMFDGQVDSLTEASQSLDVEVRPGPIANGIAVFNVRAQTVQVRVIDDTEGEVYDSGPITMLDNSSINDWYSFFYEPYTPKLDLALTNLPPYPDARIQITFTAQSETVSVGQLVAGTIRNIGRTQYGTSVGIIDFSRKEQDQFGNFNIVPRRFSKRAEYDVKIDTNAVAGAQRTLANFRTAPVVWIGKEEKEETIVYGYYRDFDIVISSFSLSDATITVEGL